MYNVFAPLLPEPLYFGSDVETCVSSLKCIVSQIIWTIASYATYLPHCYYIPNVFLPPIALTQLAHIHLSIGHLCLLQYNHIIIASDNISLPLPSSAQLLKLRLIEGSTAIIMARNKRSIADRRTQNKKCMRWSLCQRIFKDFNSFQWYLRLSHPHCAWFLTTVEMMNIDTWSSFQEGIGASTSVVSSRPFTIVKVIVQ